MIKQFKITEEQFKKYCDVKDSMKFNPWTVVKINKQREGHLLTIDGSEENVEAIIEDLRELGIIDG
jgi:hypothetical protein